MDRDFNVETALVSAIYADGDVLFEVAHKLSPSDFRNPLHGAIFDVLRDQVLTGLPIDRVSVLAGLRAKADLDALGGEVHAIAVLESDVFEPSSVAHYADLIADGAKRRRIGTLGAQISKKAEEGVDLAPYGAALSGALLDLTQGKERFVSVLSRSAEEVHDRLVALGNGELVIDKVMTGFKALDSVVKGFRSGQLIVIGARPGMGKTAFALDVARRVAAAGGKRVLFFSLEMSTEELTERMIASESELNLSRVQSGDLDGGELERVREAVTSFSGVDLVLNSDPMVRVSDIRAASLREQARGSLCLIVVDYLQLMTSGKTKSIENRQAEVAEISRSLKILARELEIPVVALSQLSRNLESRHDKQPQLSDLRDSGQIEQDADLVLFLHREEMYDENTPKKGIIEVIVAKHRNGPTGKISLWFEPSLMRFGDLVDPREIISEVFPQGRDIQFDASKSRVDASKERAEAGGDLWA